MLMNMNSEQERNLSSEEETGAEQPDSPEETCEADVPVLEDPPQRHQQDTQPVEGEDAINPPPGSDLIQRSKVQG
jgi:hypothetical protein